MTQAESLYLDLSNLKIAARLWVTGKGCRYFHSENLSDQECRELFEDLASTQAHKNDDTMQPNFGQVLGRKNAFFVAQRVPDPNNSQRNVTNCWYFLDSAGILTLPMLATFANRPALADTQAEFIMRLKTADFSPSPESSDSTDSNRLPVCDSSVTDQPKKRVHLLVIAIFASALLVVLLAINSSPDQAEPDTEPIVPPLTNVVESNEARWVTEKVKEQLREEVRVKNRSVVDQQVNELDGKELLQAFVNLFVFDIERMNLSDNEINDMNRQRNGELPNPFAEFLLELPTDQKPLDDGHDRSIAGLYHDRIKQLVSKLCTDQDGNRLDPASLNPEEMVIALRNRLDYVAYYDKWHARFQPNQKEDRWLNQWKVDGDKSWIPKVREFIKENY